MPAPDDLRAVVAVNHSGHLGLSTTKDGRNGISTQGLPWAAPKGPAAILGRLGDWLYTGRTFPEWCRDRGYCLSVPQDAGDRFLLQAQLIGAL